MDKRATLRIGIGGLLLTVILIAVAALPGAGIARPQIAPPTGSVGMVCTNGTTFNLETTDGRIYAPDGNSLYMWGFTLSGSPFQMPGPVLCVNEGDTVTVNLTNNLAEPVSIVFPGQTGVTATGGSPGLFAAEAAASGGTVSYSFTAGEPGTYLYESGTNQHKQVHMGLYGVLVVRPALGANYAYNDPDTEFDPAREYLLVLHEIDPNLHWAVEQGLPYDITTRRDHYWTINGRSMPDTLSDNFAPWLPSQPYSAMVWVEASTAPDALPALIRYANAGTEIHPFHPHGNHLRVIAKDAREVPPVEAFTKSIAPGQTMDLLFWWRDVEAWTSSGNPFPVDVPGLQNLVFKDDVTWFSSNQYLGEKSDLPVGTTSFNECGEFYFPWHSHALQEVQNFDEGFGGMMTLVRVDPPGGCP